MRAAVLGLFVVPLVGGAPCPALLGAQGRPAGSGPPARIGVTLSAPPSAPGSRPSPGDARDYDTWRRGSRPWIGDWGLPVIVERTAPVPVAVPVPYPVPYYARAPRVETPKPSPVPYDPHKASIRIIGGGQDGGAGVLRVQPILPDSLHIVWLGTVRPIREARLFVADEAYQPMRSRVVDRDRREARFGTRALPRPARFAGVTVIFADGATVTTLVPTPARAP